MQNQEFSNKLKPFLENLKRALDKIPTPKPEFNVFSALNMETDEVRCHSQMIAELLNPDGSHGKKDLFLRLFLEEIGFSKQLSNVRVLKENKNIDIQILDNNWAIIIENKVGADDQPNQLWRYHEKLNTGHYKNKYIFILYLTLDCSDPSEQTLEQPKEQGNGKLVVNNKDLTQGQVYCISYEENIKNWLEKCIKEAATEPFLRETLAQYLFLIKKITGQIMSSSKIKEVKESLLSSKMYQSISYTEWKQAYNDLKFDIQLNMWKNLEAAFSTKEMPALLEIKTRTNDFENQIRNFSDEKSKKHYYGLLWQIIGLPKEEIWGFKIEYDADVLYMGFRYGKYDNNGNFEDFEQEEDLCEKLVENINIENSKYEYVDDGTNSWWLKSYYIKKDNTHFDFANFNTAAIHSIVQDAECEEFAKDVAKAAHSLITQFIENIKKENETFPQ